MTIFHFKIEFLSGNQITYELKDIDSENPIEAFGAVTNYLKVFKEDEVPVKIELKMITKL